MPQPAARPCETVDVAVIGAGVVGCAVARRFALEGARVVVVEKAVDILDGASKGNSGILHTGFDAPPGSLEQRCIAAGYREYLDIHRRLDLPMHAAGAIVVAWTEEEEVRLPALMAQAHANGVGDVTLLTAAQVRAREPHLADGVCAGLLVPRESVIDPWTAPHAYLLQALANGAALLRGAEVESGSFDGAAWRLHTPIGAVAARAVVNCAGLHGDTVDQRLLGAARFGIRPRKGQFLVFDKLASRLLTSIVLPVPGERTKGIVICRTAFGNVLVGPTAEEQESREDNSVDGDTLAMLHRRGVQMLPALRHCGVTASYAGLRPATESKDYRINAERERCYISVGGIRSTGLSAALGIAGHVLALHRDFGAVHDTLPAPVWPRPDAIAEWGPRRWQQAGNGGIVCHCERVTRHEIEAALSGPLAARSLAGLKRRTRVTMGRCQGFYCLAALAEITRGRFDQPMASAGDA